MLKKPDFLMEMAGLDPTLDNKLWRFINVTSFQLQVLNDTT